MKLQEKADLVINLVLQRTKRMLDLAAEKGAFAWLHVLPILDIGFNLNKRKVRDALKPRYDWLSNDIPSTCVCGVPFNRVPFTCNDMFRLNLPYKNTR